MQDFSIGSDTSTIVAGATVAVVSTGAGAQGVLSNLECILPLLYLGIVLMGTDCSCAIYKHYILEDEDITFKKCIKGFFGKLATYLGVILVANAAETIFGVGMLSTICAFVACCCEVDSILDNYFASRHKKNPFSFFTLIVDKLGAFTKKGQKEEKQKSKK